MIYSHHRSVRREYFFFFISVDIFYFLYYFYHINTCISYCYIISLRRYQHNNSHSIFFVNFKHTNIELDFSYYFHLL